jgi:hypothetical protein
MAAATGSLAGVLTGILPGRRSGAGILSAGCDSESNGNYERGHYAKFHGNSRAAKKPTYQIDV